MRTQILEDWASLEALAPEWNSLLRQSQADSPFLTWEWMSAWRESVDDSINPLVVTARDENGALVGIAPFYVTGLRLGRLVPFRTLRILGDYHSGSEYLDWIAHPDQERDITAAMARTLSGLANHWDCMWIPSVSGWTGARQRILEPCRSLGFICHERPCEFAAMELPPDYAAFESSLSPKRRTEIRKKRRELLERTDMSFEVCKSDGDLPTFLEALFNLNHRRWTAAGHAGTFVRKPLEAQFYRKFTRTALSLGWIRLFGLKIGKAFKAIQIGYVYNTTFYALQEGFDPEAPKGIGNLLRSKAIEHCIREGVREYDFLGGFTEHKRLWLAKPRYGFDLFIGRRSLKNALLFYEEIWPTGRYLRPFGMPGANGAGRPDGRPTP